MLPELPFAGGVLWWLGLVALGLTVGMVSGLFGVGGGFLLTPLLSGLFGVPLEIAIGSGLCQMIGTGTAALVRHQKLKQGEIKIDWLMLGGGLIGVKAGADAVTALNRMGQVQIGGHWFFAARLGISLGYLLLLGVVAFWMLRDARNRPANAPLSSGPLTRLRLPPYTHLPRSDRTVSVLLLAYLGLFLGFLSGLLGIGGGVVLMPLLLYGIGMRVRMAAGTGILLLVATSLAGTLAHAAKGHVHLGISMALLLGSSLAAPLGATLSNRMDGQRLRLLFACLVFLTALAVLWNLLRTA